MKNQEHPLQSATGYAIIASSKTITGRSFYKRYTCYAHLRRKAALLTGAAIPSIGIQGQNLADGPHGVNIKRPPVSTVPKPIKELEKVAKVGDNPGETKRVTLTLTERDLAYYNVSLHRWVAEDGKYHVLVGSSSRDIRLQGSFHHSNTKDYTIRRVGEDMIG